MFGQKEVGPVQVVNQAPLGSDVTRHLQGNSNLALSAALRGQGQDGHGGQEALGTKDKVDLVAKTKIVLKESLTKAGQGVGHVGPALAGRLEVDNVVLQALLEQHVHGCNDECAKDQTLQSLLRSSNGSIKLEHDDDDEFIATFTFNTAWKAEQVFRRKMAVV